MIAYFLVCLPIFAAVALGFVAVKAGVLAAPAIEGIAAFAFRFALPPMLLRLVAALPIREVFDVRYFAGYVGAEIVVLLVLIAMMFLAGRVPLAVAGARATAATHGNVGYLGPPLILALLGERGAAPLALSIIGEAMVLLSIGCAFMGFERGGSAGLAVLRGTLRNPLVAGIAAGAAIAAAGITLPAPVDRLLAYIGAAAGPSALFALGGALALQRLSRRGLAVASALASVKLMVSPLAVWLTLGPLLGLDPFVVRAGTIIAALPGASNVFLAAQRYGTDPDGVSAAILVSTTAGAITVPAAAALLL